MGEPPVRYLMDRASKVCSTIPEMYGNMLVQFCPCIFTVGQENAHCMLSNVPLWTRHDPVVPFPCYCDPDASKL